MTRIFFFSSRDSLSNSPIRLSEEYNLELQYRKPFLDVWKEEKDDPELGPLSERMGVRARGGGPLLVTEEELEAASKFLPFFCVRKKTQAWPFAYTSFSHIGFYHAFCFYKV